MKTYYRPLAQTGPAVPPDARRIAGGWCWFRQAEAIGRDGSSRIIAAEDIPQSALQRITAPRAPLAGVTFDRPRLMGIVNVTPDSFSDGGDFAETNAAVAHGRALEAAGADILDIGGESTRPGAQTVETEVEIARTAPVVEALAKGGSAPVSIDTRKADVARAALSAGAAIVNDVAALAYDRAMAQVVAGAGVPVCLMHAQGDPETMQNDPRYDDVLLDVYDFLEERIAFAEAAGIPRERIIVDPGIGFGKTLAHNLRLMQNLGLFHGLGCVVLLGASRKRFIGTLTETANARDRVAGSVAAALAGFAQGVQIARVHDILETRQALTIWAHSLGISRQDFENER